jgi:hypothetical protein
MRISSSALYVDINLGDSEIFLIYLFGFAGTNLKLDNSSEGKSETSTHVSSENKMSESGNANSSSGNNSSVISPSTKPSAVSSTQQVDMKLPTEVGKEEKPASASE